MNIMLVRHGQTDWNVKRRVQGWANICLNENGKKQAFIVAKSLIDVKIDLIISSPLERALQTAEIINKYKNVPIIIDERLKERNFGEFEGLEKNNFDFDGFWNYKMNNKYLKAENIERFFNRVYDFLDEIKETYKDKKVLLVTHGGVSVAVKCYFFGIPDMYSLFPLCIDNCEVDEFY